MAPSDLHRTTDSPKLSEGSGSPVKRSLQSSSHYSTGITSALNKRKAMEDELSGHWVGPIPIPEFLETFLPLPEGEKEAPTRPNHFSKLPNTIRTEKELYDPLINSVNNTRPKFMPDFKLVNTSDNSDNTCQPGKKYKTDLSTYGKKVDITDQKTRIIHQELPWELKPNTSWDIGQDPPEPKNITSSSVLKGAEQNVLVNKVEGGEEETATDSEDRLDWCFEKQTQNARDCRGQLAAYATEWNSRQHRLHSFTILICHPYVRFLRFDRAGIVVSRRFNYLSNEGQYLVDFLWRFSRVSDTVRGTDDTVHLASQEDTARAQNRLKEYAPKLERPIFTFTIPHEGQPREFLGWGSIHDADSLIGRATRAYPVLDKQTDKLCFLKDSWRAEFLQPEADVLKILNEKEVKHTPRLICGGDIPGQVTRTHEFANTLESTGSTSWAMGKHNIIRRIHHRFVEDCIGVHLNRFQCTKDLLRAIYDAVKAHRDAYEKCGILHRDISGKNILLVWSEEKQKWNGVLNDWDLAKHAADHEPRNHQRTGTWQFLSSRLCQDGSKLPTVPDDLESFVLVALYHILRYTRHSVISETAFILEKVFSSYDRRGDGSITGGDSKDELFQKRRWIRQNFSIDDNRPLTTYIRAAIEAVNNWQTYWQQQEAVKQVENDIYDWPEYDTGFRQMILWQNVFFKDHHRFVALFKEKLKTTAWPEADCAADNCARSETRIATSRVNGQNGSLGAGSDGSKKQRSSQGSNTSKGKRSRETTDFTPQPTKKRK